MNKHLYCRKTANSQINIFIKIIIKYMYVHLFLAITINFNEKLEGLLWFKDCKQHDKRLFWNNSCCVLIRSPY